MKKGFNLTDILMAMIVVGVFFVLTIPVLYKHTDDKALVSGLYQFNDELEIAVKKWKTEIGCPNNVKDCMVIQQSVSKEPVDFSLISRYMNVIEQDDEGLSDVYWLPPRTLNYYGSEKSDFDFRSNLNRKRYLLSDGKIISVQSDKEGFWLLVDVNGKKPPNRIGKDTFHVIVGYSPVNDINYYAKEKTRDGLCGPDYESSKVTCDPENVNPTIGNGASPAAYVLIHHSLPNYKELSKTITGFKP